MGVLALVGTRKGLFLLRGDDGRQVWRTEGPLIAGWGVYHATIDPRNNVMYAAANHAVYGPTVRRSTDGGKSWKRSQKLRLPEHSGLTLNATWHIQPGRASEPETLFLGGDPGVLFRSDDGGESWQPNRGLLEHRTRAQWLPGAGGLCCHSIQLDPEDAERMYVAISAAGIYRSEDAGESWTPVNRNLAADYLPDPYPEVGQCPHKLLLHPARPSRLWQAAHCGVYRSDDRGDSWIRLDGNGLPSGFGYPVMLNPSDPDTALVIPQDGYEYHYSPGGRFSVYRTTDGGDSWHPVVDGLPQPSWWAVLREASAYDESSVYFGTQGGSFCALAADDVWVEAVRDLPPILSVEVVPWSG